MIPGVSGDLLSSSYLGAQVGADAAGGPPIDRRWMRAVWHWWRRAAQALGPASAPRMLLDVGARPLMELLDLRLDQIECHRWGYAGVLSHEGQPVATLVCAPWGTSPAAGWQHALCSSLAARLPWAVLFSGPTVAVVDATRPWARRCLAFELASASREPRALAALWAVASASALHGGLQGSLGRAVAASDAAGIAVCAALGHGVLTALTALVRELGAARGHRPSANPGADRHTFNQSLTVVYRLLFLFFAEARHLVPVWHRVYREAYSMEALCDRLIDNPRARGVWSAVQAMARLAHAGCQADDLRVTAFNGRLFAPGRTPLAEHRHVSDAVVADAVIALGTAESPRGRRRVAFHELGVEQLGAVYERVLDYEVVRDHRTLSLRPTSVERKTSGSFYTPRSMTDFLVRRTLGPLVQGRSAEAILSLRVLDPAMGSGAFLVAACRYLAERVERARIADGTWAEHAITDTDRALVARSVAERCLYGLDRNPTAVQLARLSLWLTTLAAERPLTFLDHHLAAGNSLIGARLSDLSRPPAAWTRSDAAGHPSLFDAHAREVWGRATVPERQRLALEPSETAADVRDKERRLQRLLADEGLSHRWTRAADLWCGLALQRGRCSPGLYADLQQFVAGATTALPARDLAPRAGQALALARAHDAVHWELLFPEVFLDETGAPRDDAGFDAVLGNPPWDVLRADTGDEGRRAGARDEAAAAMQFIRASGHYRLHASGHVNHYQLFLERALEALGPRGRFGLVLPAGLQCDVGSAGLRRLLLDRSAVDTWISFDNRRGIFPIHRSVRFLLVAGSCGGQTPSLTMIDGGADPSCLTRLPDDPRVTDLGASSARVSRGFLERWDAAHLTIPHVASRDAMAVAARALDAPALAAPDGWHVTFGRELNASDDRKDFVTAPAGARTALVPVVEGKHLRPFGVNVAASARFLLRSRATALLAARWTQPRVCYRDVASATNRLTLMAAVLPAGVVSTHTLFCARTPLEEADAWCLMALLNSLVANCLVRLQMTTHVTTTLMARLPVPRPSPRSAAHDTLVACARSLSRCAAIEEEAGAYAHLNAVAADLYGLAPDEYTHVVSTFPLLPGTVRHACLDAFTVARRPMR